MTDQLTSLSDLLAEWDTVQHQPEDQRADWLRRLIDLRAALQQDGKLDPGKLDPNFRPSR
jgi:hypothetical protein